MPVPPTSEICAPPVAAGDDYRYRLYRPAGVARGLVAYLPHFGGTIDDWETSLLPGRLIAQGIGVIVGLPMSGGTGYLTDADLLALDSMLHDAIQRAECPPEALVLGGFSAGGVGALRYAQAAGAGRLSGAIRPRGVFGVDPPLDLRRWYRGHESIARRRPESPLLGEAVYICSMLRELLGGTPAEAPAAYARVSVLSADAPQGGNLKLLSDIPVRLYTEPDPDFWLGHGADLYCLNALDVVYAVAELRAQGNDRAELIVTHGKGFRPDLGGIRLPHAWSIVDESELAVWIEGLMG